MAQDIDQQTINQEAKNIEATFKDYLLKLKILQDEQNAIIGQFIKELEGRRIQEIRNKI
ncbi:MAG: hypothetical protein NTX82_00255 [Candidatus Parcubacteria bacterium]|nr:hypothetical protein [Candidatus Parcubacteria bacterium]